MPSPSIGTTTRSLAASRAVPERLSRIARRLLKTTPVRLHVVQETSVAEPVLCQLSLPFRAAQMLRFQVTYKLMVSTFAVRKEKAEARGWMSRIRSQTSESLINGRGYRRCFALLICSSNDEAGTHRAETSPRNTWSRLTQICPNMSRLGPRAVQT